MDHTTMSYANGNSLKGKLNKVKCLLDSESRRLQEEASQYHIFATKTSASPNQTTHNGDQHEIPINLRKTINDIGTLRSVLACPIFNHVVNSINSLDELSNQVNLHPSIGPADIEIDPNGELILAPPIQSATHHYHPNPNNNSQDNVNYLQDNFDNSIFTQSSIIQNQQNQDQIDDGGMNYREKLNHFENKIRYTESGKNNVVHLNGSSAPTNGHKVVLQRQDQNGQTKLHHAIKNNNASVRNNTNIPSVKSYNTEKLISNGEGNGVPRLSNSKNLDYNKSAASDAVENPAYSNGQRLYRSNGQMTLDQTDEGGSSGPQSLNQFDENNLNSMGDGITNEMYTRIHNSIQVDVGAIDRKQLQSINLNNEYSGKFGKNKNDNNNKEIAKQQNGNVQYLRGSCSPSTSIGSTVRLADECDSGASSYQSQCNNNSNKQTTPTSPENQPQATSSMVESSQLKTFNDDELSIVKKSDNVNVGLIDSSNGSCKVDQSGFDVVDDCKSGAQPSNKSNIEYIKVTLNKYNGNELGIILGGYTCAERKMSGIFIRRLVPGSQAEACGLIREVDQVYAVNGIKLLGYSNQQAIHVLKNTGKSVTLDLARFTDEAKNGLYKDLYLKLRNDLMKAAPESGKAVPSSSSNLKDNTNNQNVPDTTNPHLQQPQQQPMNKDLLLDNVLYQHVASKKPLSKVKSLDSSSKIILKNNDQPQKSVVESSNKKKLTQQIDNNNIKQSSTTIQEHQLPSLIPRVSHGPMAMDLSRHGQVIETKQGSRNTVDIRSPLCRAPSSSSPESVEASATYINKLPDADPDYQSQEFMRVPNNNITNNINIINSNNNNVSSTHKDTMQKSPDSPNQVFRNLPTPQDNGIPEWDEGARIIELFKDPVLGLGFVVKEYTNPKDPDQSIIMVYSITPNGVADRDGRLSIGDRLIFVDDMNLEGANLAETARALRKTNGQVRLGVLKIKH